MRLQLVAVLKEVERNTTLAANLATTETVQTFAARVKHLLTLSRGGRRILGSQHGVPRSFGLLFFAKSSNETNAIFHFLREKPGFNVAWVAIEELAKKSL